LYLLYRLFNFSIWIAYIGALTRARQTLLFSATFSKEVRDVAAVTLRQGYTIVDTVGEEVEQTHSHVVQEMMSIPVGKGSFSLCYKSELSSN
jgi:superfamily II DNA/RNA helicase